MRFLFSTLGLYLLRRTGASIALVAGAVAATIMLLDLVEQLRDVGTRVSISLLDAAMLSALRAPQLLETTLPFVVLAGVMLALFQLNRRSELVAIRATGVSAWRFLGPSAAIAAGVGLAAALVLNPVGSALYARYETERTRLIAGFGMDPERDVWLRQGDRLEQVVISADRVDAQRSTIFDAVFLFFDVSEDGALSFARRVRAGQAELRGGFWQLSGVVEAAPGAPPAASEHLAIPSPLDPDALLDRFVSPSTLSLFALPGFIAEAQAAGLTPTRYELRLHNLLALPALLAAMASLGAAFSLRLQRLGGVAIWALAGISSGAALFFAAQIAAAFAVADIVPPALAAWAPPIGGVCAAMAVLSYLEDG